ncbi:hypothetical protein Tco_0346584, partial [Tanacetum coccineum]
LLDYIRTADPRKVQAVEVLKREEQVTLFDSIKHSFVSLDDPAAAHQASGSGSGAGAEKDTDISLLDSRASYLKSALDDSQAACGEARNLISSLSSERDGLASEVSTLHSSFRDFKEKIEAQQEANKLRSYTI